MSTLMQRSSSRGAERKASTNASKTPKEQHEQAAEARQRQSFAQQSEEVEEEEEEEEGGAPLHLVSGALTIARGLFLPTLLSSDSFLEATGGFLDACYQSALNVTAFFIAAIVWVLQLLHSTSLWVLGVHQEPRLSTGGGPTVLPRDGAPFRTRYSAIKKGVIQPAAAFVDTVANAVVPKADSLVESFLGVVGLCAEAALTVGLSLALHAISIAIAIGWSCLQLSATIVGRLYPCVEDLLMSGHGPPQDC